MAKRERDPYDFSVNMTTKELIRLLAYAEENGYDTVGVHFTPSYGIGRSTFASGIGGAWKDRDNHVEVTDEDAF